MYGITVVFLTFSTVLASIFWFILKFNKLQPISTPPGPVGLPILGYLPFLHPNLHRQFDRLSQKYGPIFKLWLGSKLCIVISSPFLIKQVVRDHDITFASRDATVAALAATGGIDVAWQAYGSRWRDLRKLLVKEMLSHNSLDASYAIRRRGVRAVVGKVHAEMGRKLGVGEMIFEAEMNVAMNLAWGGAGGDRNSELVGAEVREVMHKMVDLMGRPNVSDFFPVLGKWDVLGIEKEMKPVVEAMHRIFDSVIEGRAKKMAESGNVISENGRKDFLQILLELQHLGDAQRSIDPTQIKSLFTDFIVGGTDTTSTILEWAMTEILNNPHVMKRVQQELDDVVGTDTTPEESHIPKLHYLDAVVKETFRLYPPIPLLVPKYASESCNIGGYTVPKGSRVFLNMWAVQRDPEIWENPSEFKPERFLDEPGKYDYVGNNFSYLPFGSGRRVCPGIPLGEKMVMHLLATLFHLFDWEIPKGEKLDLSEQFGIIMRKKTPLSAVPSRRRQSDLDLYA